MAKTKRDINVLKAFKKELNLSTQVVKPKKTYSRKTKHKKKEQ